VDRKPDARCELADLVFQPVAGESLGATERQRPAEFDDEQRAERRAAVSAAVCGRQAGRSQRDFQGDQSGASRMIGIIATTEFSDLLEITLPWNLQVLEQVLVVTHPEDQLTIDVASKYPQCELLLTEVFRENGAYFNKWAAVQMGCDYGIRHHNWACLLDADIMLPLEANPQISKPKPNNLYCPRRRAVHKINSPKLTSAWRNWRLEPRDAGRHQGHCLLFHTLDQHLKRTVPGQTLFPLNVVWAGAGEQDFIGRWAANQQLRPAWDCLELQLPGNQGINQCGRVSVWPDGTLPALWEQRAGLMKVLQRQSRVNAGLDDRYQGDRVGQSYTEDPCAGAKRVLD